MLIQVTTVEMMSVLRKGKMKLRTLNITIAIMDEFFLLSDIFR